MGHLNGLAWFQIGWDLVGEVGVPITSLVESGVKGSLWCCAPACFARSCTARCSCDNDSLGSFAGMVHGGNFWNPAPTLNVSLSVGRIVVLGTWHCVRAVDFHCLVRHHPVFGRGVLRGDGLRHLMSALAAALFLALPASVAQMLAVPRRGVPPCTCLSAGGPSRLRCAAQPQIAYRAAEDWKAWHAAKVIARGLPLMAKEGYMRPSADDVSLCSSG